MRTAVKRVLGLTLLGGASYAAWRAYAARRADAPTPGLAWEPQPFPAPPRPVPVDPVDPVGAVGAEAAPAWVAPDDDGNCPEGYPVKAKVASGIFHVEGGRNYARTRPDRCYPTPAAAEADGLRPAKS